ncbi:MAG: 5-(carboxyamino)imidazole ribonucleotide mutase [Defluviitaleaceae bacterium]|nr:5-(carboxyamino)imidazole ribonucleotide mutase [Defluviitaleaceae bacterium]
MAKIGIIMGSDSDLPVMKAAADFLESMNIEYEIDIVSAHRTPEKMFEYAKTAYDRGVRVIIAGAGGAAHLPGMVASLTALPVIGVPVKSNAMSGIDSLYSIVQMPGGIPVATVAINGALNAGILTASILGTSNSEIYEKVKAYKESLKNMVLEKSETLELIGYEKYLESM